MKMYRTMAIVLLVTIVFDKIVVPATAVSPFLLFVRDAVKRQALGNDHETPFQYIPREERNDEIRAELEDLLQSAMRDAITYPELDEESEMTGNTEGTQGRGKTSENLRLTQRFTVNKRLPVHCLLNIVACWKK